MKFGSITTGIVADGLVFNMDAANRASYPHQRAIAASESGSCFNTLDTSQSGSFMADPTFLTAPTSASCWAFDGVDDEIKVTEITTAAAFTLAYWAKLPNLTTGAGYLFNKGGSNNHYYNSSEILYIEATDTTSYIVTNSGGVPNVFDNGWHYFVVTKPSNVADGVNFYFDNEGPFAALGSMAAASTFAFTDIMHFPAGSLPYAQGTLANIHLYNRALSTSDVLHNYNALKSRFT
jgi:hypothetical protein